MNAGLNPNTITISYDELPSTKDMEKLKREIDKGYKKFFNIKHKKTNEYGRHNYR